MNRNNQFKIKKSLKKMLNKVGSPTNLFENPDIIPSKVLLILLTLTQYE